MHYKHIFNIRLDNKENERIIEGHELYEPLKNALSGLIKAEKTLFITSDNPAVVNGIRCWFGARIRIGGDLFDVASAQKLAFFNSTSYNLIRVPKNEVMENVTDLEANLIGEHESPILKAQDEKNKEVEGKNETKVSKPKTSKKK